jgi:SET domain-containing protein
MMLTSNFLSFSRSFMAFLEKVLFINKSQIPGAGMGLFTTRPIAKGEIIVEYKGKITTWKEFSKQPDERNGYVFYIFSTHVIDAWGSKKSLARYANDARGIARVKGLNNNSEYHVYKRRCFIRAVKDIPAGAEVLVDYGKEYWDIIRFNMRLDIKAKKKAALPHHTAD